MAKRVDFTGLLKAKWLGGNRLSQVPKELIEGFDSTPQVP